MTTVRAGWYPSEHPGWLRFWDGYSWTLQYSPDPQTGLGLPTGSAPGGSVESAAAPQGSGLPVFAPSRPSPPVAPTSGTSETTLRRLADYERLAGYFWIGLGVLQILLVVTAIAGIWNIFVGTSRLPMSKQVREGRADVPQKYEGLGGYVLIALVNLVFGAVLGLVLVGVDLFVRDQILKNAHLFNVEPVLPTKASRPSASSSAEQQVPPNGEGSTN